MTALALTTGDRVQVAAFDNIEACNAFLLETGERVLSVEMSTTLAEWKEHDDKGGFTYGEAAMFLRQFVVVYRLPQQQGPYPF